MNCSAHRWAVLVGVICSAPSPELVTAGARDVVPLEQGVKAARADKAARGCNPKKPGCTDTVAPVVAIATPGQGAILTGTITVGGTASDNVAVAAVEVRVDGDVFQLATGTSSWSLALNTPGYAPGAHTIGAQARDAAGNLSGESRVAVEFAPASDGLTVTAVRLDRPTLVTLGVQVLVAGDRNCDGRIEVFYREPDAPEWREGPPLLRVLPETVYVTVPDQFAGSVFDLRPGTTYEIRLLATDPDGDGPFERTIVAATRPVPRTEPAAPRYLAVSDAAALRSALSNARAGDVITITQYNFVISNNLFVGPETLVDARSVDWRARIDRGVFDFNGYFPDGQFMFGTAAGADRLYPDFASVQAAGVVEPHGVLLTGAIFEGGFVGPADERLRYDPADVTLHAQSAAVDRGERLPGVNDEFTGAAPDLGAWEVGCAVPSYGPRPEGQDGVTAAIDCQ